MLESIPPYESNLSEVIDTTSDFLPIHPWVAIDMDESPPPIDIFEPWSFLSIVPETQIQPSSILSMETADSFDSEMYMADSFDSEIYVDDSEMYVGAIVAEPVICRRIRRSVNLELRLPSTDDFVPAQYPEFWLPPADKVVPVPWVPPKNFPNKFILEFLGIWCPRVLTLL